jgi:uncharacterized membrane protein required for colicin V production
VTVVLNLLLVIILGFCVWQGYRKGLILTAAGVLVLILAIWGASGIAGRYAADFEERINPLFGWVSDEATEEAMRANGYKNEIRDPDTVRRVAAEAFSGMGIVETEADKMAGSALDDMRENSLPLKAGVSNAFIHAIYRVLLFIFVFAVIALLLTLLSHFVSMLVKMPVLKQLDTIGGLAAGFVYGLLLLFAVGWILRFLGILLPQKIIDDTILLRFLVNHNLLAVFL